MDEKNENIFGYQIDILEALRRNIERVLEVAKFFEHSKKIKSSAKDSEKVEKEILDSLEYYFKKLKEETEKLLKTTNYEK